MDASDKKKFFKIMTGLAENFSAQISGPGLALRFEALERFDIGQIEAAAISILNTRERMGMPTVAEFVRAIEGETVTTKDDATIQVNEIMRQIRELGSYRTPVFDDPVTKSLMSSRWSWQSVFSMTETELKWFSKEFIETYQSCDRKADHTMIDCAASKRMKLLIGGIGR
jgi:hypothetical protein